MFEKVRVNIVTLKFLRYYTPTCHIKFLASGDWRVATISHPRVTRMRPLMRVSLLPRPKRIHAFGSRAHQLYQATVDHHKMVHHAPMVRETLIRREGL